MITIGFKNSSSSWLRATIALGLGVVVLVTCLQNADPFALLVKVLACFVIGSGIFTFIYGMLRRENKDFSLMMVNTVTTVLIGIGLFVFSGVVARFFFYMIAIVLIIFGVFQLVALISARTVMRPGVLPYIGPVVVIMLGSALLSPTVGNSVGYICAAALILYGISEILTNLKMRKAIDEVTFNVDVDEDENEIDEQ